MRFLNALFGAGEETVMNKTHKAMRCQVFGLAWPVILELSGVMLTGAFTTGMVGRLGAVALAAVGISTMVQFAGAMVVAAFGTGASAIIGRESGAGNLEEVRRTTGQAILLGVLLGVVVAVAGFFSARSLFNLIGADPAVAELAGRILEILFLFTPLFLVMVIGNAALRGLAKTRTAFFIGTFSNLLSLVLSYIMIFGAWGIPASGAMGVAWSTGISQLCGGLVAIVVLSKDPHIRLRWRDVFSWKTEVVKKIVNISVPAAMEQAAMQGGRVAFTFLLTGVGVLQFAGHQIALQVESLSFLPGFGFSVAVMTLVSHSMGKKRPRRAEQFTHITGGLAFLAMAAMGLLFFVFAEPLTKLFIDDPEVIRWGTLCVMIAAFEQPTIALANIFAGALRGAGDTRWPMYVTILGVWVFRMPLVYLCVYVWKFSIISVWVVTVLDFLIRSLILWWRFREGGWKRMS